MKQRVVFQEQALTKSPSSSQHSSCLLHNERRLAPHISDASFSPSSSLSNVCASREEPETLFTEGYNAATFLVSTGSDSEVLWSIPLLRTTSLLERTNRELRRTFRQAGSFSSRSGAEVAIYLQVRRLHARWTKKTWWDVSHELYFDLCHLHP